MEARYDPAAVEERIRKFWEENETFRFDPENKKEVYAIDTPPPTVSGDIHLGHAFSYSQAEFIARYKRMRGFNVFYPFGLDNNGLPTEMLIEKKFDTTAEKMGRDKFIELVRSEIKVYNEKYIELWKRLGLSVDWSLLYQTISPEVQKISQKSFLELNKINRAYRKESPALYCPKDRTTVSQMELKDKTLKSKIIYINFAEDVKIATTRPEMLPACVAIFVGIDDPKHKHLVGKEITVPIFGNKVKVIADRRVDPEFGTGVVMCCTFGDQTDIEWYKAYNLELKIIIDEKGRMNHPYYNGLKIKEAREKIIKDLNEKGYLISEEEIEHNVNVHDRCGTEIEFIVKKQWYIKYLDLKEKFLELGSQVNWYPAHMKIRYDNWVNALAWDWSISRQRFFGVFFPIWYCRKCDEPFFADEKDLPINPFVDKPNGKCSKCGSIEFDPETDIMDTWATSSLTPMINARWGAENNYVKKILPMKLRAQAHDIISFWAFNTIVKSYFHTGTIPWKDIMISGHGLDSKGQPMHKSAGNVVSPEQYLPKYGADPIRYWASSSVLGEDNSFQEKEVITGSRLINKMWNLARFIELKCLDFEEGESNHHLDNWILMRLDETIKKSTDYFDNYNYFNARTNAEQLFWEFANDYLEFVKDRIYSNDKHAAHTINLAFLNLLKMLSPFIPFVTEEIYQEIFVKNPKMKEIGGHNENSIHKSSWPEKIKFNETLGKTGAIVAQAIVEIRKKKHEQGIALNEQIKLANIGSAHQKELSKAIDEIKSAMKVGEIHFEGSSEAIVDSIVR